MERLVILLFALLVGAWWTGMVRNLLTAWWSRGVALCVVYGILVLGIIRG
jgi:hypothetical protein